MDKKVLISFGIFLLCFVLVISGMEIYKNLTKVKVLKEQTIADVSFDEDKKNIYLFWGNGCVHCEDLRVYLEENTDLWQDDYQIFSFEVNENEENYQLVQDLLSQFDQEFEGTPTMIIGSAVIVGFGDNTADEIARAIDEQKDNSYDVVEEYQNNNEEE